MKAVATICMAVLFGLGASSAGAFTPTTEAGIGGEALPISGGCVMLYDQTDDAAGNGAPAQDFEADFDAYDCEGADDFTVTFADGWDVQEVHIVGTQSTGGVSATLNLAFHADNAGVPGAVINDYAGLVQGADYTDNLGTLHVILPTECHLDPGTYWMVVQVQQDFAAAGQYFWSNRVNASGYPSLWRNPGGGFGTPCTDWGAQQADCGVGGGTGADFLFSLCGAEHTVAVESETWGATKALYR